MRLGADAYWIKEGLDEQMTAEESVRNYISFLEIAAKAVGKEYKFLKKTVTGINTIINRINNNTIYSGRKAKIIEFQNNKTLKKAVIGILSNSIFLFKDYLARHVMQTSLQIDEDINRLNASSQLCNIVNKLGSIVEIVHFEGEYKQKMTQVLTRQGAYSALLIWKFRGATSHFRESEKILFDSFKLFFALTLAWLDNNFFSLEKNFSGLDKLTLKQIGDALSSYINQDKTITKYVNNLLN